LQGPNAGRIYPLVAPRTVIGRLLSSDVTLSHPQVSRTHAAIEARQGTYLLSDLDSTLGTLVRGVPIQGKVPLRHGDTFQVGGFTLGFLDHLEIDESDADDSTVVYAMEDLPASQAGDSRALAAILDALRAMRPSVKLDEVLDRVVEHCLKIFPTSRRVLVCLEEGPGQSWVPRAFRARDGWATPVVSTTILRRVRERGEALLCRDPEAVFPDGKGVICSRSGILLCAPLFDARQRPIGAVQVNAGRDRRPFDGRDLALLAALAGPFSNAIATARSHARVLVETAIEAELRAAACVHSALMPPPVTAFPAYRVASHYQPTHHIGGDYLGVVPLPDPECPSEVPPRRWAFIVGDVCGKGLTAALYSARLSAEVRVALQASHDPLEVLEVLTKALQATAPKGMYVTLAVGVLDRLDHRFACACAGHWPPLVRRAADGRVVAFDVEASGMPVPWFEKGEARVVVQDLAPGDVVAMFTDGILDAEDEDGARYGHEALRRVIASATGGADEVRDAIVKDLARHVAQKAQCDDITLLCLSRDRP
jgi:serine phosphatase RsbU (regulator of sigma subunit)